MIVTIDAERIVADVLAEVRRHAPRSPQRRIACHLWSALVTSRTVDAARVAITTFGEPATQEAAAGLLGRLITEGATTT